jgi:uncharacterized protein (TIRG00374 family)
MLSRRIRLAAALGFSGLFLYLFFCDVHPWLLVLALRDGGALGPCLCTPKFDGARIAGALRGVGAGWWLLFLAALIQILHCALRAWRWRILLGPLKKDIGFHNLFSTVAIGYMISFVTPGRIGEVVRPVLLAGREKISKGGTLATVLLERLMDALTVAMLFATYLIFFLGPAGGRGQEAAAGLDWRWGAALGAAIVLSFPVLWAVVHYRRRVAGILSRVVPETTRTGHAVHGVFHSIVDGFEVLKGARALAAAWGYSFLIWGIISFSIWFSVRAFGISIRPQDSLLMLGALTFGIAIPTQGGVGTYEWFGQQALTRFLGVEPSQAAAAVLVMHVFAISPVILLGFYYLWKERLSFSSLARGAAAEGAGAAAAEAAAGPVPDADVGGPRGSAAAPGVKPAEGAGR